MDVMIVKCPNPQCGNFGVRIAVEAVGDEEWPTWIGVICGVCGTLLVAGPAVDQLV